MRGVLAVHVFCFFPPLFLFRSWIRPSAKYASSHPGVEQCSAVVGWLGQPVVRLGAGG